MKLSAYPCDGFKTKPQSEGYRVLCDGNPLELVLRVDTEAGVAWVAALGYDGRVRHSQDGNIIEREVHGQMRLIPIAEYET